MDAKDEKKGFLKSLFEFWASKGVTNLKIPQIGGRELDMHHLYKAVCKRGGAQIVSENKLWKDIVNEFGLPPSCTSASFTLRNHYSKYLLAYEQKYHFGRDDDSAITELVSSRGRKQAKPYEEISGEILRSEVQIPVSIKNALSERYSKNDKNEEIFYTKRTRITPLISEIKRIMLAFESRIQTEVTFALNCLLLYSCNTSNLFMLEQYPSLLDNMTFYFEEVYKNLPFLTKCSSPNLINMKNVALKLNLGETEQEFLTMEKVIEDMKPYLNPVETYNYPVSEYILGCGYDLDDPIKLMKEDRKNLVTMKYEQVSEIQLLEQFRMFLLILRNLSYTKGNDQNILKQERLFSMLLQIFLTVSEDQIQRNLLEIFSNITKSMTIKSMEYGLNFLLRIISFLSSESAEEVESAIDCLRNLVITPENDMLLGQLLPMYIDFLTKFFLSPIYEIRDKVLELLCYISDLDMSIRVTLSKCPKLIMRLIALMSSGTSKGHEKIAKLCAIVLSNISLAPASKPFITPYEKELFIIATCDENISKIVCNILGDIDEM